MPRKSKGGGRGGPRVGTPGTAYANRSDLQATQPVRTPPSQTYGDATASQAAQRALPLPGPGASVPSPSAAGPGNTQAPPMALPGQLGPLNAPTQRPSEPITAGLNSGPGPGPEAVGMAQPQEDPTLAQLKGILARFPNQDLQALIAQASARR